MSALAGPAGFYGKLPTLGDFVSRRLPRQFIDPWDLWLQDGLAVSRAQLGAGWLDVYLTSPIWRFGLSSGVCGAGAWVGILMPSVDRVGRYFPLTIAAPVADPRKLAHLFETGAAWFDALEKLALAGLEERLDLNAFDRELQSLEPPALAEMGTGPEEGNPKGSGQDKFALRIGLDGVEQMPSALIGLGGFLLDRFLPAYGLWATGGSERVGASLLVCEGLPPVEDFASLMTGGRPRQRGWSMKFKQLFGFSAPASAQKSKTAEKNASPPAGPEWRWQSCGISVVGNRRKINEDAFLERPDIGLWMVADGMGGHRAGDVASRTLVEALETVEASPELDQLAKEVETRIEDVNGQLHRFADESMGGQIVGSTVVALMAKDRRCVAVWAGDSRLYRYRDGRLEQLTQDHSLLDELVKAGVMSAEQALKEGSDNIITRAVGAESKLDLDSLRFEAVEGDVFLLCSDGLAKELGAGDIGARLNLESCKASAQALIDAALASGGRDNITVIVIHPSPGR
jgi:type VI secretion system protein ImpM